MAAPVPSTGASPLALHKPSPSSSSSLPLLLSTRPPLPPLLRSHYPASHGFSLFTQLGSYLNRSGDSSSPPKFRGPPGFNDESWVVVIDKPGGEGATEEQMVDCYIQILAQVVGSEDEAVKKIYRVLSGEILGFGCVIDDQETARKLKGLPGVLLVRPDPYVPEYNDPADTLKHFSLNLIRFSRHKNICIREDEVEDGGSAPKWYNEVSEMAMERVEDYIHGLSSAFKALDSDEVYSMMQSRVEQVLSELSVYVKQLCGINSEEAGKDKEKEKALVMEQVKKAMESLSLAQEAVDLLHSDKSHMIMAQKLKQLSEQVMKLADLTTQEADANHDDTKEEEEEAPDEEQIAYAISFTEEETGVPVFVGIASDMAKRIDSGEKMERMLLNMKKFTKYRENYKNRDWGGNNPICSLDLETYGSWNPETLKLGSRNISPNFSST